MTNSVLLLATLLGLLAAPSPQDLQKSQPSADQRQIPPSHIPAQIADPDARAFFDLMNWERRSEKIPEMRWNENLAVAARHHSELMAKMNTIDHRYDGEPLLQSRAADAGTLFSSVAENVGRGDDTTFIHTGFMLSPGHRANILSPKYDEAGIGVVRKNGLIFVTEDFIRAVRKLTFEEQAEMVATQLRKRGLTITNTPYDATLACTGTPGSFQNSNMYIMHIETSDLTTLPEELEKKLDDYAHASVAGCPTEAPRPSQAGFTRYRITVLLY